MCGRYSLTSTPRDIADHFSLVRSGDYAKSFNVSPAAIVPVVRLEYDEKVLANLHWGLIPRWARDSKLRPINAKAETVDRKPFFRSAFRKSRCLIPANGFYEWMKTNRHKQPYYFRLKDTDLLAFAGLWDHWEHEGEIIESCTIITTAANEIMKPVHERMPVILSPDNYDAWLLEGNKSLLQPYTGAMIAYPVSSAVNNPQHNSRELVEPV